MSRIPWIAWAAIAIPVAVLFGPALLSDQSLVVRDAGHFYHPLFAWCRSEWGAGRVPLWNPYDNCGAPVLADATSSVFYPGKLLFALPLDFALLYKAYVVLHVLLAAGASYRLARTWQASPAAAAMAAIAYACGGAVVFQYCNVVFLVGAAWLPAAAAAADVLVRRQSWQSAVALGTVLALMILGGDPQAAYHALLITASYALLRALLREPSALGDSANPPAWQARGRALVQSLALVAGAAAIGGLLAAVQVLPSSEAAGLSERAAFNRPRNVYEAATVAMQDAVLAQPLGETRYQSIVRGLLGRPEPGSHHDLVYDFSIGPWRLIEYVWPNVGGRMFPTHRRWFSLLPAEGRTWTPTLYLGLLPVVLAVSSLRLRGGSIRERWLSVVAIWFTLGSLGLYGLGWLVHEAGAASAAGDRFQLGLPVGGVYWLMVTLLPTYVYFRYPAKLLPLVALALSQLAAGGWDRAFAGPQPRLARALGLLGMLSAALGLAVWVAGLGLIRLAAPADASLGPFDRQGAYYDVLLAFVHAAVVAFAARWLLQQAWAEPGWVQNGTTLALLLTAAELAVANAWLVGTAPAELWRREPAVARAILRAEASSAEPLADAAGNAAVRTLSPVRVYRGSIASWRPPSFKQQLSAARPAELGQWEHDTLFPKHHLGTGLALVESYGSIKLMDYESFLFVARQHGPAQPDKSRLPQPTALRLLATQYLVLPDQHAPVFAERLEPAAGSAVSDGPSSADTPWPESAALWRMKRTLPRAWVVYEVAVRSPLPVPQRIEQVDARTKEVLFPNQQARNFSQVAVIETHAPPADLPTNPASREGPEHHSCRLVVDEPQRVVVEADLARPGLLVLADAYFPGWRAVATSGGAKYEVPIYRTNRVLRGIWLPAGRHSVEFQFQPASFVRGAWISAAAWTILAVLGMALGATRSICGTTQRESTE